MSVINWLRPARVRWPVLLGAPIVALLAAAPPAFACFGFLENDPCTLVIPGSCEFIAGPYDTYDIVATGSYVATITSQSGTVILRREGNAPTREQRAVHPGDAVRIELRGPGSVAAEGWTIAT